MWRPDAIDIDRELNPTTTSLAHAAKLKQLNERLNERRIIVVV